MLRMTILFSSLVFTLGTLFAGGETMPLADVKPGMQGVGKTIFSGTEIEEFDFKVLDIIPNFRAKRDLILVQLIGEKVERTSVAFGMSGSPMYIDGKLIGALSSRFGLFTKDPIGGVTPIGQMVEIFKMDEVRKHELASRRGLNPDYLEVAVGVREWQLDDFIPPYMRTNEPSGLAQKGFEPLKPTLVFSGFERSGMRLPSRVFDGLGFEMTQSGGGTYTPVLGEAGTLEPGSAYAVVLADGDLGIQATGTVTLVDGEKVVGMGHSFLNSGAVALPMAKARILTTLSSWMASTKMSALTGIVGTVHQDRTSGIMGISGEPPKMLPVELNLDSRFATPVQYNFRIAEDRSLHSITPLLLSIIINNALESFRLARSNQTLKLTGQVVLSGYEPILLQNYYAGSTPAGFVTDAQQASGEIASIIGALLSNNFEPAEIEAIKLTFQALPQKYLGLVDRIEVNRTIVAPGDEVTVTAVVREYQGKGHRISHKIKIPDQLDTKRINIFAGSGITLTRLEARNSPQRSRPKTFAQLVRVLNDRRNNNFVFFQIFTADRGIQVSGEPLPGLPPSVRSVVRTQKASGNVLALRDRVIVEDKVETDFAVSGGRTLWLKVKSKKSK